MLDANAPSPSRVPILCASVGVHVLVIAALLMVHRPAVQRAEQSSVEVTFFQRPLLPPAAVPIVSAHPPPLPRRSPAVRHAAVAVARPALRVESQEKARVPVVMQGIVLRSTAQAAPIHRDVTVRVGNTLAGAQQDDAAELPYQASKFVDIGDVSEPPGIASRADLRKFYPREAAQKGFEGLVMLRLLVDGDGTLGRIEIVRDPGEGLGPAAVRAIREFRFTPARMNGEGVATTILFTLHFVLS